MLSAETTSTLPLPTRRRSIRPYLAAMLLGEVLVLLYLLPMDPVLMRQIRSYWRGDSIENEGRKLQALMQNDLAVGASVPMEVTETNSPRSMYKKATRLIFIGACTGCTAQTIMEWERMQKRHGQLRIVLVSNDAPETIREFHKATPVSLPIVADPKGKMARAYNAVWFPRAYLIDAQGKLKWLQKTVGASPWFVMQQILQEEG